LPAGRVQFVIDVSTGAAGSARTVAVIVVGKHIWARVQKQDGTWPAWKLVDNEEGFYYVLAFMGPQVCPQLLTQDLASFPTHLLRLVGGSTTAGSTTWHLRGRKTNKRRSYAVNAYVDRESNIWSRITVKDIERNQAGSSSTDTQYSAVNEPINIKAPKTVSH
jgi:hypothetical protein